MLSRDIARRTGRQNPPTTRPKTATRRAPTLRHVASWSWTWALHPAHTAHNGAPSAIRNVSRAHFLCGLQHTVGTYSCRDECFSLSNMCPEHVLGAVHAAAAQTTRDTQAALLLRALQWVSTAPADAPRLWRAVLTAVARKHLFALRCTARETVFGRTRGAQQRPHAGGQHDLATARRIATPEAKHKNTDRHTGRQTDGQTDRQTGRQIDASEQTARAQK